MLLFLSSALPVTSVKLDVKLRDLRELAITLATGKTNAKYKLYNHSALLFAGSEKVGKTTLINIFLDKNELAKKTLALEYTFARKTSSHSLNKDVCHVWELGGGTLFAPVLNNGGSFARNGHLTVVLMLDLSRQDQLWTTLETLLREVRKALKKCAPESASVERNFDDHPDKQVMNPFPVPLIIVGGKYDIFKEFEPEKKKLVCRCLRYLSHILCANLLFYSSKDSALVKRAKDLLSYSAFGSAPPTTVIQDYNKPLSIPSGMDLLQSIERLGASLGKPSLEKITHVFTAHFPQDTGKLSSKVLEDPANDPNFREPTIDSIKRQKDEELERYCQEMERREKRKESASFQSEGK